MTKPLQFRGRTTSPTAKRFQTSKTKRRDERAIADTPSVEEKINREGSSPALFRKAPSIYLLPIDGVAFGDILLACKLMVCCISRATLGQELGASRRQETGSALPTASGECRGTPQTKIAQRKTQRNNTMPIKLKHLSAGALATALEMARLNHRSQTRIPKPSLHQ